MCAMRLLVLGGTAWLGRAVAEAARDEGDNVVCLARGESGEAAEGVQLVRGDRRDPATYDLLPGEFDAAVDVSRQPGQVRGAAAALEPRCTLPVDTKMKCERPDHRVSAPRFGSTARVIVWTRMAGHLSARRSAPRRWRTPSTARTTPRRRCGGRSGARPVRACSISALEPAS
ncbi:putative reductase [Frankia alni ACN14a]|uniref:Reductase n=1 Tax=Frankia alni (strain DSM 45986 / CECT 9034 / ACN14a) TaxID=326424 RepID=Q0RHW3_FRAAA|nr:putative reductase [Frankia alni ACN14a]